MTVPLRALLLSFAVWTAAATAAPVLELQPRSAHPGDAVWVVLRGAASCPAGTFAGLPLGFYRFGDHCEALAAIPLELSPGPAHVAAAAASATLEVLAPEFPARELHVAPKFIEPPESVKARIAEDKAAFAVAWAQPLEPRVFQEPFIWPRAPRFTGHFGDRRVFNGKLDSQHYGDDLEGRPGSPIQAANAGKVVMARECYASGNTVILHHGAGLFTAYFHLSRILVKPGQQVRRGELLGEVGNTGRVTGPHLHFAVHAAGLYVNPGSLVGKPLP